MTNISKQPLSPEQEQLITQQISVLFTDKSTAETSAILKSLLGPEEHLMIAKRFAIIVMLWKQYTMYAIAQKLHVSSSTVARIETKYQQGKYTNITTLLNKPTLSIIDILESIDSILHLGGILPHYGQTYKSEAYKRSKANK